nr:hypothetical protein [Tanacetum cinerariifolium]
DDEVTPGKVTILNEAEEESDWDDDERSGGKNLAIQERHAQNQQDFLDKEEFSDDEVTLGKVTILNEAEEESDWDDDERSGGKNLAIQERHAQNQQDFLDKYLP